MPGVQARVQAQATWLNETLRSTAAADVEGVVLLAHTFHPSSGTMLSRSAGPTGRRPCGKKCSG